MTNDDELYRQAVRDQNSREMEVLERRFDGPIPSHETEHIRRGITRGELRHQQWVAQVVVLRDSYRTAPAALAEKIDQAEKCVADCERDVADDRARLLAQVQEIARQSAPAKPTG